MLIPQLTRRRLAGFALLALAALGGGAWWSLSPGRVTRANFDRIRDGMTVDEVMLLLGPCKERSGGPADELIIWETGPACVVVNFIDGRAAVARSECYSTGVVALAEWVWHYQVVSRLPRWGRP
jgi:hypothetical protein